ncbi:hypothetical protein FRC01_010149 [Tulasnella sp. 417]|nr:hypothetical protein FRC01_010149 [Tulasnella sp. 417]
MELTHLGLEATYDDEEFPGWVNGDFFDDMLAIFQLQPSLKSFSLVRCPLSTSFEQLVKSQLSPSDAPALKSLTARPFIVAAFLSRVSGLEDITFMAGGYFDCVVKLIWTGSADNRSSIRKLTFNVAHQEDWVREQVPMYMSLFPNVEKLKVKIPEGVKHCLDAITFNIHALPSIRYLEIDYVPDHEIYAGGMTVPPERDFLGYWDDQKIFKGLEFIRDIKATCPQLEIFVDPDRRVWDVSERDNRDRGFSAKLLGKVELEPGFVRDVTPINRKVEAALRQHLGLI